jgi:TRAP-type C4-dicarboxylate transport system permease small subunit
MSQQDEPTAGAADHEAIEFVDPPIDLSDQNWTDGLSLVLFWALAVIVFLQFFTRYVLNDSIAWTEEIARYFLIAVTFVGAVMAVRKQSQIAVEFLYRWLSRPARQVLQGVVDVISIVFYAALTLYSAQLAGRTRQAMVSIDVPKSVVYWLVAACFAAMTAYAIRNAWRHWRSGTSALIDPEAAAARTLSE